MNKLNVIAYLSYLPICVFITFYVGKVFYINGRHYLLSFFGNNESLVDAFNKILLVGYYLLNIGYSVVIISFWPKLDSVTDLIESVSTLTGMIILILGIMHVFNMFIIYLIAQKKNKHQFNLNK